LPYCFRRGTALVDNDAMKSVLLFVRCLAISLTSITATFIYADLPAPIAASLRVVGVPQGAVALYVREVGSESAIIEHRATTAMNPASTMKIVTTLVGLDLLSPNYRWKTEFLANAPIVDGVLKGPLIIRGSGDPKFTWEHLQIAVKALRDRGVRDIAGDVLIDRSRFANVAANPSQFDGQPLRPYNVAPDALLYNYKSVGFKFSPQPNNTVAIATDGPSPDGLTIVNRLSVTGTTGGLCGDWHSTITPAFETVSNSARASFTGTYPIDCGDRDWYVSLFDHTGLLAGSFARMWRDSGGVWTGLMREGKVPRRSRVLFTHTSAPLSTMVTDINKYSNNVMARQLLLTFDAEMTKSPARATRGGHTIREWAKARGFDVPDLVIENGAGLSRTERISAKSMAKFLEYGLTAPFSEQFVQSLPIAATDGTLIKRFNNQAAEGNAYLKTGTLAGVKTLSGYLMLPGNRKVIFVGMINHPRAEAGVKSLDLAVDWMFQNASTR
jgi:serine-type D-Ala-D-Ala carboxypeptidase/endopeptidase (penicillin-binding protein 4)